MAGGTYSAAVAGAHITEETRSCVMVSWMIYTGLVGVLVWFGALNLERVAAARALPRRIVWSAAIGLAIAWTAFIAFLPSAAPGVAASPGRAPIASVSVATPAMSPLSLPRREPISVDRIAVILWLLASTACIGRLVFGSVTLARRRRAWRRDRIDDLDVCVASHDGPAVVGFGRMDIVVPEWTLALDAPLRAMLLCHETEHRRAHDPRLLFAGAIAAALMPWNVALWLMNRRLRLAVEMDCDARVLRAHPSPYRYGLLMLTVAQRRATRGLLLSPTLAEPITHLERRITAMRASPINRPSTYAAAVVAFASFALAASIRPVGAQTPATSATAQDTRAALDAFLKQQGFQSWTHTRAQRGNAPPRYPDAMRQSRTAGTVLAQFIVDSAGAVDPGAIKILSSTNDDFSASVRQTLPSMRFDPAQVDGRKVKQLIQVPFAFYIDGADRPAADSTHRSMPCGQGICPVLRLDEVVVTAR